MSHNYLNKNRTQELINTIRGHLSDIATVLSNLASGDARDNTKAPINHNQPSSTITAMTGYTKPQATSAITASDTLNEAIGKLEKAVDDAGTPNDGVLTIQQNGTTLGTFSANQSGNTTVNIEAAPAPYIISNAVNSDDGTSVVENTFDVGVTDTVNYSNLFVDETYTLKTKVYNTVTQTYLSITKNGTSSTEITSTITPSTNSGSYSNAFSIDDLTVAADNTVLNVVEKLYYNNEVISTHTSNVMVDAALTSWDILQQKVRHNKMSSISIGDQFISDYNDTTLTWDVIDKNHDTPANPQYTNSLTLKTHYPISRLQYDVQEAFYYCPSGLSAGVYRFKYNNSYRYFTLTQAVPAGGQLYFTEGTLAKVSSYSSPLSQTPIQTVNTQTSYSYACTDLGELKSVQNGNFNMYDHCVRYGNERWDESDIRQWLNSDKPSGEWWAPQNNWDRPPSIASTLNGFLYDLDPELKEIIGLTAKNTYPYGESEPYTTLDTMFLLSTGEVGGGYSFYSSTTDKIVYEKSGAAVSYWTRTASSRGVNYVNQSGGNVRSDTHNTYSVVVACNII